MRSFPATHKVAFILLVGTAAAWAQTGESHKEQTVVQTLYLKNAPQQADEYEIATALRNTLNPATKLILVPSQKAIVLNATPDQIELARTIISNLDLPQRAYRVIYTLIDMDGTKRIGEQSYSMVAMPEQKAEMKQGSRVPVVVADVKNPSTSQITYLDVGMNFEVTLTEVNGGLSLKTKVERSSIADDHSSVGPGDPVVRQSLVEGTTILTPGKASIVGSFDIPDSTRHLDVQVSVDPLSPEIAKKAVKP